ncbi:MAG TPA: ABC transporter substrate-binding protein, partial [bacterium]|nr:ABC transporter substrate-binding protein [bacterium]
MPFTPPKRIASFSYATSEILSYLGFSEEVTTLKEYCEAEPLMTDRNKPEYWFSMAEQRVHSLKADLALTFSVGQQDLYKRLKEKGFNVMHLDPRSLKEVEDAFLQVGKVTGTMDRAKQLTQDFAGGLAALKEKIPFNAYRPKLYVEQWNKPPSAAGGWYSELMVETGAHYFPMLSRGIEPAGADRGNVEIRPRNHRLRRFRTGPDLRSRRGLETHRVGETQRGPQTQDLQRGRNPAEPT